MNFRNLRKSADTNQVEEIKVANCPVCNAYVSQVFYMQDSYIKRKSKWFACHCGVVFNSQKADKVYDQKYWLERSKYDKKAESSWKYPVTVYAPIIEELMYGRRVLIVGRPNTYQEEAFSERGWVPTLIDKNTCFETKGNLIAADFETYMFPESQKYNLIWLYGTLECMANPVGTLELCHKILADDGIIYIETPDTDFINIRSSSCFIHWKADEHNAMWNKRSLIKKMDELGLNTIMCRSNYEHRFAHWDTIQGIFQKKFF